MINIDSRNLIYFNYKKIDYVRRDYLVLVQKQTNASKKTLREIRIYELTINKENKINLLADAYEVSKNLKNEQSLLKLR